MTYFDVERKETNMKVRVVVPDYLLPIIDKHGKLTHMLQDRFNTRLAVCRARNGHVTTCEGVKGALVNISGEVGAVVNTIQALFEEVAQTEQRINGKRKF